MTPVIERLCLSYETKAEDVILSFNKLRNYDSKAWAEMAALSTEPLLWVCEDSLGGRNVELMPLHNDPLVVIAHEGSNFELSQRDARRSIQLYEVVFRELGFL